MCALEFTDLNFPVQDDFLDSSRCLRHFSFFCCVSKHAVDCWVSEFHPGSDRGGWLLCARGPDMGCGWPKFWEIHDSNSSASSLPSCYCCVPASLQASPSPARDEDFRRWEDLGKSSNCRGVAPVLGCPDSWRRFSMTTVCFYPSWLRKKQIPTEKHSITYHHIMCWCALSRCSSTVTYCDSGLWERAADHPRAAESPGATEERRGIAWGEVLRRGSSMSMSVCPA